jgi:sucrose-6-phosphate hydrolase SacC (GH32 family)
VLLGANSQYATGTFDGTRFTPEQTNLPGHRGRGFYAPQTFSDIPTSDGRRIQIGWFQTETRGMSFNQSMTVPLELKLVSTSEGPRMSFTPVKELESLRTKTTTFDAMTLKPGDRNPLDALQLELMEIRAEIEPSDASEVVFNIRDSMIIYDAKKQEISVNGQRASAPLRDGKLQLTIYGDRTGLEVFASDGLCYIPMPFNANPENRKIFLEIRGQAASVRNLVVHELRSAWR